MTHALAELVRERTPAYESETVAAVRPAVPKSQTSGLTFRYDGEQTLCVVSMKIPQRSVTALIGPSGCATRTFRPTLNRMNDIIPKTRLAGEVSLDGTDISAPQIDVVALGRRLDTVTHNLQQAAWVSDLTVFFLHGRLFEFGRTQQVFTTPKQKQTDDYIAGRSR